MTTITIITILIVITIITIHPVVKSCKVYEELIVEKRKKEK
jgi:hypothetical protein